MSRGVQGIFRSFNILLQPNFSSPAYQEYHEQKQLMHELNRNPENRDLLAGCRFHLQPKCPSTEKWTKKKKKFWVFPVVFLSRTNTLHACCEHPLLSFPFRKPTEYSLQLLLKNMLSPLRPHQMPDVFNSEDHPVYPRRSQREVPENGSSWNNAAT